MRKGDPGNAGKGVGKHRINRMLMENFSVEGRRGDLQTWFLGRRNRRPHLRAIDQVGMFDAHCSLEVDDFIAGADSKLEDMVRSIASGQDPGPGHWGDFLESMAVQFVRSTSGLIQIKRELDRLVAESKISPSRAEVELNRLLAHSDVGLFRHLVNCAASSFSHCRVLMMVPGGEREFITSDKVLHAATDARLIEGMTGHVVWMPFSPRAGMLMGAIGSVDPILKLTPSGDGQTCALEVSGPPRERAIKGSLNPRVLDDAQVDRLNCAMLAHAQRVFATDVQSIDAAIRFAVAEAVFEPRFRYRPI